jgi:hypothetical protein
MWPAMVTSSESKYPAPWQGKPLNYFEYVLIQTTHVYKGASQIRKSWTFHRCKNFETLQYYES